MQDRDSEDATVATCGKCAGVIFVAVTAHLDKEGRKEIGEIAAEGGSVRHMACSEARLLAFGCKCKKV